MSNVKKYKLNELLITEIWKDLHVSGNEKLASKLSKEMINQGCDGIPIDDVHLVLMFWKDYLEENGIASFTSNNKITH
jgi:hypothetical protein